MALRGTMVLRRVRIMIGGVPFSALTIPSSVGSFDIPMIASIAPASSSSPRESLSYMPWSTSRAVATASSGPSISILSPRAEMNTPKRFSTCTRLASNCPKSSPSSDWFSKLKSTRARRTSRKGTGSSEITGSRVLVGLRPMQLLMGQFLRVD